MQAFAFSGRTRGGESISGERQAESLEAAVAALRREQILITRIDPVKVKASRTVKVGGKVPAKSLAIFTRQFSVMIDAGLPLVQCLDILASRSRTRASRRPSSRPARTSRAACRWPMRCASIRSAFDALFTNMVAGRRGGRHPRHHSQASGDLHREERQAHLAGQVGDDLPGRGHRASPRSWSRSSCGRSFRPSPRCSRASARSCRCRPASSSR